MKWVKITKNVVTAIWKIKFFKVRKTQKVFLHLLTGFSCPLRKNCSISTTQALPWKLCRLKRFLKWMVLSLRDGSAWIFTIVAATPFIGCMNQGNGNVCIAHSQRNATQHNTIEWNRTGSESNHWFLSLFSHFVFGLSHFYFSIHLKCNSCGFIMSIGNCHWI